MLDVGLGDATYLAIWLYACNHGFTVISKDEDFLGLASTTPTEAALVWIRIGNCRKHALINAIDVLWPKIETALNAGERVIEVR